MKKLNENIKKFLDVYRFLPAEAKAAFEAQIASHIKDYDQKTQNLYSALLSSAKENLNENETIERMKKVNSEPGPTANNDTKQGPISDDTWQSSEEP